MTGAELRNIRECLHMTQVDFALALGKHEKTVCNYERDVYRIPASIAKLARMLREG